METSYQFEILNGRFDTASAQMLLTEICEAKIKHHAKRITQPELTEEDIKASERRMQKIEEDLRGALRMIREAAKQGKTVDLEGSIHLMIR